MNYIAEKNKSYKTKEIRKSNLAPAGSAMDAIKRQLGLDEDFFTIAKVWEQETGSDSEIAGFKDNVIYVKTPFSAVMSDLTIRKKEIINKLNQYVGSKKIKNIKIEIK